MKLEIGGGIPIKARGDGWINIDQVANADIRHDLDSIPWPLPDNSVDEVYSSHCLEHLKCPFTVFDEICRVCRVGAAVEIRVPHPASHLAMTAGHVHVFSPVQAVNVEEHFPREFWKLKKRMRLNKQGDGSWHIDYGPVQFMLDELRMDLPMFSSVPDSLLQKWFPGTCHECRFFYTVVDNEYWARGT